MMLKTKFTDKKLAELYIDIAKQYKELSKPNSGLSGPQIYEKLREGISYSLYDVNSTSNLKELELEEQPKAYEVLDAFFYALPENKETMDNPRVAPPPYPTIFTYRQSGQHRQHYCNNNNDFLLNWYLLNSLSRPYPYQGSNANNYTGNSGNNSSSSGSNKDSDAGAAVALLLVLAIAATALVVDAVALYYLINECLNSLERFWFNEGWVQATIPLAAMIAGGALTGVLTSVFLAGPLVSLAAAAGISTTGFFIFTAVSLSIAGAALSSLLANQVQKFTLEHYNPDAMDREDPHRYTLTESEEKILIEKEIDPIKVKCAIVALRGVIGRESLYQLFETRSENVRESLTKIRKLRRGESSTVDVGQMQFNCNKQAFPPPAYANCQQFDSGLQQNNVLRHDDLLIDSSPPAYDDQIQPGEHQEVDEDLIQPGESQQINVSPNANGPGFFHRNNNLVAGQQVYTPPPAVNPYYPR